MSVMLHPPLLRATIMTLLGDEKPKDGGRSDVAAQRAYEPSSMRLIWSETLLKTMIRCVSEREICHVTGGEVC